MVTDLKAVFQEQAPSEMRLQHVVYLCLWSKEKGINASENQP